MLQYETESNHIFTDYTFCLSIITVYQPFSEDWVLLCSAVEISFRIPGSCLHLRITRDCSELQRYS